MWKLNVIMFYCPFLGKFADIQQPARKLLFAMEVQWIIVSVGQHCQWIIISNIVFTSRTLFVYFFQQRTFFSLWVFLLLLFNFFVNEREGVLCNLYSFMCVCVGRGGWISMGSLILEGVFKILISPPHPANSHILFSPTPPQGTLLMLKACGLVWIRRGDALAHCPFFANHPGCMSG